MAEEELATRAPEVDASASATTDATAANVGPEASSTTSRIPGDTAPQTGPSMSEHCTSDRPTPASANPPAGEFTTLNGVSCYVSKPSDYPHNPGKLLFLLTGGTGIKSTNNQLQADAYAHRGFLVVMPDQFSGDTAPNVGLLSDEEAKQKAQTESQSLDAAGLLERIKMGAAEAAKSFLIDMWLARHTPEKVLPIILRALDGARESFGDAVANGGGIYGVGYCFGAKYVLILCGDNASPAKLQQDPTDDQPTDNDPTKPVTATPVLKVGTIAHGTLVTKEDIEAVKSPISMVCVAGDNLFPDDVREQGRASLELNAVDHDIRLFSDVPHGFAVLGDYSEERIQGRQAEAFEIMCSWLEAH